MPDHTTLSRRGRSFARRQPRVFTSGGPVHLVLDSTGLELFGQGEWCAAKHGRDPQALAEAAPRRGRHYRRDRPLRSYSTCYASGTLSCSAHGLTDGHADDAAQVPDLLRQPEATIASLLADGAYDGDPVYQAAAARQPEQPPDVVIPPRSSAVPSTADPDRQSPRDRHIQLMAEHGRMRWQRVTGYSRRNVVEATMARYKGLIGPKLQARHRDAQAGEVALSVQILNRMIREAKPVTVRRS